MWDHIHFLKCEARICWVQLCLYYDMIVRCVKSAGTLVNIDYLELVWVMLIRRIRVLPWFLCYVFSCC